MNQKQIQHFEYASMDVALKQVEALVTRGYQASIAPLDYRAGFSVSAPERTSDIPTEGAAA